MPKASEKRTPDLVPGKIETSTATFRERAWHALKDVIGPIASFLGVFVILLAGIRYFINAEVADLRNDVKSLSESVVTLRSDVGKTNDRMDGIFSKTLERLIPQPSSSKNAIRGGLEQTNDLLQVARDSEIKVDPGVISAYGRRVAALADDPSIAPMAWRTMTALLGYRSFLNSDLAPKVDNPVQLQPYEYIIHMPNLPELGPAGVPRLTVYRGGGRASPENSARLEALDLASPSPSGAHYLLVEAHGGYFSLDFENIKNVVIHNAKVVYTGEPVRLENVYFVNCTFQFNSTPRSLELGTKVVSADATTFDGTRPS